MKTTLLTIYCLVILGLFASNCSKSEKAPAQQPEPTKQAVEKKAAPEKSAFKVEDSNYDHMVTVKEMAFLWTVDGESLKVKLAAKTTGWLGIGFNPEPGQGMKGANFLLGSVKDGKAVVEDHFGTMQTNHKADEKLGGKLDVTDISGKEADGLTELMFTIPLNSGDNNDKAVTTDGDTTVMLAYGKSDIMILKHTFHATLTVNLSTGASKVVSSQ